MGKRGVDSSMSLDMTEIGRYKVVSKSIHNLVLCLHLYTCLSLQICGITSIILHRFMLLVSHASSSRNRPYPSSTAYEVFVALCLKQSWTCLLRLRIVGIFKCYRSADSANVKIFARPPICCMPSIFGTTDIAHSTACRSIT